MIVAVNGSGLGNRIKAIVSCMRISPDNYGVHWVKNRDLFCEFKDLFRNNVEVKDIPSSAQIYESWRLAVLSEDDIPEGFNEATNGLDRAGDKFSFTCPHGRNIDIEYDRIPNTVREEYLKYFNKLKINPSILMEVKEFSKKFDENTVSIHIRSWRDDDVRKGNFHRLEKFIAETKKFDENTTFYLTSDSDEIKSVFKDLYGDRVFIYDRKSETATSRVNPFGIQEDFIEMLLLSKNNYIIGTYLSTYTEAAWWFGGAKAEVRVC
ncbi:MAG TPA: hypothetical protein DCX27_12060 [Balneola sp.]|nr:hypothetical protein [Balneola sp.]|tara:strand:+ start:905 stop:1699 length:795 start_codon:yes stop_codon:yes gene_type:complete